MLSVKNYRSQDFRKIRKHCQASRLLFEDPEFPASPKSVYYTKNDTSIVWMRPKELCKLPKLIVEGVTCDDLNPGELDNSWFTTACASLVMEKKLWEKVFVSYRDQEWSPKNAYNGMFRLQFWRFGTWIEVVIDDRLPTRDGKLIFIHSKSRNEFWAPLLEKAYAKLFGDYESLQNGESLDAMVDFTGGVGERLVFGRYDLNHAVTRSRMFEKLQDACENNAHIMTRIDCKKEDRGYEAEHGLMLGQGYVLTSAVAVNVGKSIQGIVGTSELQLVRLFNPWEAKEWTGPWSDGTPEWKVLHPSEWEKMGVKFQQEGEFWMSFDDYLRNFTHCDICHFVTTAILTLKKSWHEAVAHGEWTTLGRNGGGVFESSEKIMINKAPEGDWDFYKRKFIFKFLYNPQWRFDIDVNVDRVMVSVEQHDVKGREALINHMNIIGFHLLKIEDNRWYRVHIPGELSFTSDFSCLRSVFGTSKLSRGRYLLLPTTRDAGFVGQFMIRLYTASKSRLTELTEEAPSVSCPFFLPYRCVTYMKLLRIEGLTPPPTIPRAFQPYVVIKCEGETIKSGVVEDTTSPVFNVSAIFYRKKPEMYPIYIRVMHRAQCCAEFVSEAIVKQEGTEIGEEHELGMWGKGQAATQKRPGKVFIFIRTSTDITLL